MPSFFVAVGCLRPLLTPEIEETLKYLFLFLGFRWSSESCSERLFSDDNVLPLDQYVLSTEAHPVPILRGLVRGNERTCWLRRLLALPGGECLGATV